MSPGVHDDVPNEEYHASDGISKTGLVTFDRSPALYRYGEKSSTRPQQLGTLFHCALLEPDELRRRYFPTKVRLNPNDKAYKTEESKANGRELIKQDDWDSALRMRDQVMKETVARELITSTAIIERSAAWIDPETSVLMRCRPDLIQPRLRTLVDLKKCQDARDHAVRKAISTYKYHWAEAIYCDGMRYADGWEPDAFVFFFIEEQAPYLCRPYEIDPEDVSIAREDVALLLPKYRACLESDYWPRLPGTIQRVGRLPRWAHSSATERAAAPNDDDYLSDIAF